MGEAGLNTRDRQGLVHAVRERPDDLKMGSTMCRLFFTWPIYTSGFDRAAKWEGTEAMVTCLSCIGCR